METSVATRKPNRCEADLLAVLVSEFKSEGVSGARVAKLPKPLVLADFGDAAFADIVRVITRGDFSGKKGESALLHPGPDFAAKRLLLIGMGDAGALDASGLRAAAGKAVRSTQDHKGKRVAILPPPVRRLRAEAVAQALAEGAVLGNYRFDRHQSKSGKALRETQLLFAGANDLRAARKGAATGVILAESQNLARDLSNEAPNLLPPVKLAEAAKRVARETGLQLRVLQPAELEKRGMGAMLAVAQGSANPARLIVLEHNAPRAGKTGGSRSRKSKSGARKTVCLIGKGVCFDSGGLSLKPAGSMVKMKHDMSGGAAVIGALRAIALLKLPQHVVGIVGAVENMPSGTAYRVDDVLKSASGKSIEVTNTDAEGRLVLADCLHYAQTEYQPAAIVDFATLTGACIIALGRWAAAAIGNNERLRTRMVRAGEATGERYWPLPLWDEHLEHMKSRIADIRQTGGRDAGTITAAAFLAHFVAEDQPWLHLDIAGMADTEQGTSTQPTGATGFGVRSVVALIREGGLKGL